MKKIIILLSWVLLATGAHAELLAGNTGNATNGTRVALGEWGFGVNSPILQARPMITGSEGYNLTSIFFGSHLYHESGAGGISVSVHADNGSIPGSIVAGGFNLFSATSATIGDSLVAGSSLTLAPNSTYWFVVSADQSLGATRYWWNLTDNSALASDVTGFGMPLSNANNALGWAAYSGAGPLMDVNGTVVPEPATISLFGLGGLGSFLARRKRQRRMRRKTGAKFEEVAYVISFIDEEREGEPLGIRAEQPAVQRMDSSSGSYSQASTFGFIS